MKTIVKTLKQAIELAKEKALQIAFSTGDNETTILCADSYLNEKSSTQCECGETEAIRYTLEGYADICVGICESCGVDPCLDFIEWEN